MMPREAGSYQRQTAYLGGTTARWMTGRTQAWICLEDFTMLVVRSYVLTARKLDIMVGFLDYVKFTYPLVHISRLLNTFRC
jgi:hypothetical protein